jgi:quaternary ammonium compound-resistance protein SugE
MSWMILFLAGLLEVAWAVGMKHIDGFSRPWVLAGTVAATILSVVLLGLAMKNLPLGTAYAVWTGIGAIGTFIVGILWLGDSMSTARVLSAVCVLIGLIGLKLSTP